MQDQNPSAEQKQSQHEAGSFQKSRFAYLQRDLLIILMIASIFVIVIFEIFAAVSFPLAYYAGFAGVITLLVSPALIRLRRERVLRFAYGVFIGSLIALWALPWNSRKVFLRDLGAIKPGMTVAEARAVMKDYKEGTSWPAHPDHPTSTGELTLKNSLVFRHSDAAAFNSDWGIVEFEKGRVVKVEFSAD